MDFSILLNVETGMMRYAPVLVYTEGWFPGFVVFRRKRSLIRVHKTHVGWAGSCQSMTKISS